MNDPANEALVAANGELQRQGRAAGLPLLPLINAEAIIAVVTPLIERQVRDKIAAEIDAVATADRLWLVRLEKFLAVNYTNDLQRRMSYELTEYVGPPRPSHYSDYLDPNDP